MKNINSYLIKISKILLQFLFLFLPLLFFLFISLTKKEREKFNLPILKFLFLY